MKVRSCSTPIPHAISVALCVGNEKPVDDVELETVLVVEPLAVDEAEIVILVVAVEDVVVEPATGGEKRA